MKYSLSVISPSLTRVVGGKLLIVGISNFHVFQNASVALFGILPRFPVSRDLVFVPDDWPRHSRMNGQVELDGLQRGLGGD